MGLGILRMLVHGVLKDLHFFRARSKLTLRSGPRRLLQPPLRRRCIITKEGVPSKVIEWQATALGLVDSVHAGRLDNPTRLVKQPQIGKHQARFQQFEVIFAHE